MRSLQPRVTIKRLMILVALVSLSLAWGIDLAKKRRLLDLSDVVWVDSQPLVHPVKILKVEENRPVRDEHGHPKNGYLIDLADGRVIEIPEDPAGLAGPTFSTLDVREDPDGLITVHTWVPTWHCGTGRPYEPLIRIPINRVVIYRNYRRLLGRGRVLASPLHDSSREKVSRPDGSRS